MPVFRPRTNWPQRFSEISRRELHARAFRPVERNTGTNYPCTASELHDATTPNHHPRRSTDFIGADEASYEVWAHNARGRNLSQGEYDALCRLEDVIYATFTGRQDWTPDLIIKAFCDLDRVFFLGQLRGHVHVKWASASWFPQAHRRSLVLGQTVRLGGGNAVIRLNADAIFGSNVPFSPFKETWRTLLHEMCHAYEYTQVASRYHESNDHGVQFGTKILAVERRARHDLHLGAVHSSEHFTTLRFSAPYRR